MGCQEALFKRAGWLDQLLSKHDSRCFYCQFDFAGASPAEPWERATIDHFIPLARGGEDTLENAVLACRLCNTAKGDLMPDNRYEIAHRRRLLKARKIG